MGEAFEAGVDIAGDGVVFSPVVVGVTFGVLVLDVAGAVSFAVV